MESRTRFAIGGMSTVVGERRRRLRRRADELGRARRHRRRRPSAPTRSSFPRPPRSAHAVARRPTASGAARSRRSRPPTSAETVPAPEPDDVASPPIVQTQPRRALGGDRGAARRRGRGIRLVGCRVRAGPTQRGWSQARIDAWIAAPRSEGRRRTAAQEQRLRRSSTSNDSRRGQRAPTPQDSRERGHTVRTRPHWSDVRFEERSIARFPRPTRLTCGRHPQPGLFPAPGVPQHRGLLRGRTARAVTPSGSRRPARSRCGPRRACRAGSARRRRRRSSPGRSPCPTRG